MSSPPKTHNQKSSTYKDSGVDIDAGNELVKAIMPLVKATARTGADSELGGFGGVFDLAACNYKDPILVAANDGVGTKLKIAIETGNHKTIGIDLVAMCVNDLIVQGAEPLFFLDYFATGTLDIETARDVIAGIAEGCKQANCALIGGETAEMPSMYQAQDYDLAGFAVGAVERTRLLPRTDIQSGDVLLGLASSGIHSNGYSLVRHLTQDMNWNDPDPTGEHKTLGDALLVPTRIYVQSILSALRQTEDIKALVHITGGGFQENIPRALPDGLGADIYLNQWQMPPLFRWLQERGNITENEMLRTFNCGIGMIIIVKKAESGKIASTLESQGERVFSIGEVTESKNESEMVRFLS